MTHLLLRLLEPANILTAKEDTRVLNVTGDFQGQYFLSNGLRALIHMRYRPSGLATHMNSHTGERRKNPQTLSTVTLEHSSKIHCLAFVCTFPGCDRRYTTLSNLRRHCQTHEIQFGQDESEPDPASS